ncbi:MAG: YkgJ family cysteine cluster protein [Magnetococcales bacterium]|nr:YkgJ family cysteine cluster protein [Magnetococcales bacterium]
MEKTTLEEISNYQRQTVGEIFSTANSPIKAVILSVEDAHQWFDKLRKKLSSFKHIACTMGCSWCCNQRVSLSYAEAFNIGWYIDKHIPSGTLKDQIISDTKARWQTEDRLDSPSRFATGIPCPFLNREQDLCLIHAVRPFSCRWYESLDEMACKKPALENSSELNIPYDPRIQQLAEAVEEGMLLGFQDQGFSNDILLMTGALTIFWSDKNCFSNWCAKGQPFKNSQVGNE